MKGTEGRIGREMEDREGRKREVMIVTGGSQH